MLMAKITHGCLLTFANLHKHQHNPFIEARSAFDVQAFYSVICKCTIKHMSHVSMEVWGQSVGQKTGSVCSLLIIFTSKCADVKSISMDNCLTEFRACVSVVSISLSKFFVYVGAHLTICLRSERGLCRFRVIVTKPEPSSPRRVYDDEYNFCYMCCVTRLWTVQRMSDEQVFFETVPDKSSGASDCE